MGDAPIRVASVDKNRHIAHRDPKKANEKRKGETPVCRKYHYSMTRDEARKLIVDGINYAAYKETDSSLHELDKNRLFGSEHYKSGRDVVKPSPWSEGDFEEKMTTLLRWANVLNRSDPVFADAQRLLQDDDSVIGRIIRRVKGQ